MEITEIFGSKVFDENVMRARLPAKTYKSLKATSMLGKPLDPDIADVVATTMKDWAISQSATHYSHWFQPLSGRTAGKHDSFLSPSSDGRVMSEFSSAALIRGEPDASSFPSGGLRATFEARGYTVWDPTSPAFVRDGTLFIPTAFSSYTGEALDAKTPLLRSMQTLAPQAMRILRLCGNTTAKIVLPTAGAEQEYFLIDREKYEKRLDLMLCGRTLFGRKSPKGQELEDHYCGRLRLRVADFMRDLDEELWSLGVPAKTKHNEAAPSQHELAPIYETDNIACDHNLLTMDILRVTAKRHGLACLLHEKPFDGVNGSGKHNNFSIASDDGVNFLDPSKHPEENKLFLLTLCAIIETVDTYADLLRLSAATPGNDCRLGGNEAPPAIISVFLGECLTDILTSIAFNISPEVREMAKINEDIPVLPNLAKDDSDRNRTSPFAFTGNKFEFRMPGASQSIAFCNVVLNTGCADAFARFADRLEAAADLEREIAGIIADTVKNHGRIIFNGNNYTKEWAEEAKRRGLPILNSTLDALPAMIASKNVELFSRNNVLNETECRARYDIMLESFIKVISVEAETMLEIANRQIFPACVRYLGEISKCYTEAKRANADCSVVSIHTHELSDLICKLDAAMHTLAASCRDAAPKSGLKEQAEFMHNTVRPQMADLRRACDALEEIVAADRWPLPTYTDLLHRV